MDNQDVEWPQNISVCALSTFRLVVGWCVLTPLLCWNTKVGTNVSNYSIYSFPLTSWWRIENIPVIIRNGDTSCIFLFLNKYSPSSSIAKLSTVTSAVEVVISDILTCSSWYTISVVVVGVEADTMINWGEVGLRRQCLYWREIISLSHRFQRELPMLHSNFIDNDNHDDGF